MAAAQRAYLEAGGEHNTDNPADPYMTVLGYFNNLRELGGARRILEEEVQNTIKSYGARKRVNETAGLFADRTRFSEVLELTSRVSTDQVAEARRRLEAPFHQVNDRVDCALATNMISVGLDIPRLGLMLVIGQPMLTAEYIQATSRVGRDDSRPGLVVTLLNFHKPRDRSHYERFRHYHESFYRSVEASSVTPFSARALDRGFVGAMVALARHAEPQLSPPRGVEQIAQVRAALERHLITVFRERVNCQDFADAHERDERLLAVQNRIVDLLDAWQTIVHDYQQASVAVQYQLYEGSRSAKPLLHDTLEQQFASDHERKFRASRSLRDVEPDVNLYLRDLNNRPVEE
ncbi:MAG: helicase C-terminal domain-containing protein [Chloroflexaceae bacterium]|nr:helicase C-terminal domain-containing protein [Chloroflexaceae bacterium]